MKIIFKTLILFIAMATVNSCSKDSELEPKSIAKEEPVIAFHFVLKSITISEAKQLVDSVSNNGFNTIMIQFHDGVNLTSTPWIREPGAWSISEFMEWVSYAREHKMTVIPEIKLLTHQKKLLQDEFPDLMYNSKDYDPNNPKVYEKVFLVLDEIITLLDAKIVHIGHDEILGAYRPMENEINGEPTLPADLFLKDILIIYDYLTQRNVKTWMWGDMLISESEFPTMLQHSSLSGDRDGYGKTLRDKLPRDIVICDWHYRDEILDFPSLSTLRQEGFNVIGATFQKEVTIKNFSKYAANNNANGMIATTWNVLTFQKDWDKVNRIIQFSGATFKRDFKDD